MSIVRLARFARDGLQQTQDRIQAGVRELPDKVEALGDRILNKITNLPLVNRFTQPDEEEEALALSRESLSQIPADLHNSLDWANAYIQVPLKKNVTPPESRASSPGASSRRYSGEFVDETAAAADYALGTRYVPEYQVRHEMQPTAEQLDDDDDGDYADDPGAELDQPQQVPHRANTYQVGNFQSFQGPGPAQSFQGQDRPKPLNSAGGIVLSHITRRQPQNGGQSARQIQSARGPPMNRDLSQLLSPAAHPAGPQPGTLRQPGTQRQPASTGYSAATFGAAAAVCAALGAE
ncbi:hypothetical protein GNI_138770 [Gregarina niphandrodes]|uniref:Uncharacterized protein n=1 Tax=Gregarina niphandrodes TaxID=110365 RepID=A0A023B0T9_GRENI|nr:hypothetical protein GNI_138770 [Gregarina niphandrodes]EZG45403.1 hypothetical protein GNI_138770 [Gregarina niphandrodes]|eukprot:XP_011132509.1 hypothetical protein GNI_138770 [Gregarina niphandrodes]